MDRVSANTLPAFPTFVNGQEAMAEPPVRPNTQPQQASPSSIGGTTTRRRLYGKVVDIGGIVLVAGRKLGRLLEAGSVNGVITQCKLEEIFDTCAREAHQAIMKLAGHPISEDASLVQLADIRRRLAEKCKELKWSRPRSAGESNVKWEEGHGQLLLKKKLCFDDLILKKRDMAKGHLGIVSMFATGDGHQIVGKRISYERADEWGGRIDDLKREYDGYRTIVDIAGPHRNVLNVYGIATIGADRFLLMDAVPGGQTGEDVFNSLRQFWNESKITSAEYWSGVQFITRRLLDAVEHLGKAGVVHGDIKPDNFLVDEQTGELKLFDLDCWQSVGARRDKDISSNFASPDEHVGKKSDVFTAGTALLFGVEGDGAWGEALAHGSDWAPNKGLENVGSAGMTRTAPGQLRREVGQAAGESDYTRFVDALLSPQAETVTVNRLLRTTVLGRISAAQAKEMPFLTDSILDDEASAEVLTRVMRWSSEGKSAIEQHDAAQDVPLSREQKKELAAEKERFLQEKKAEFSEKLNASPDLETYAGLHYESVRNPELRSILEGVFSTELKAKVIDATILQAQLLAESCPWFSRRDSVKTKVVGIARPRVKSGVNVDGKRLAPESLAAEMAKSQNEVAYATKMLSKVRARVSPNDSTARFSLTEIKAFVFNADRFLAQLTTLGDFPKERHTRIDRLRRQAFVSRRLVDQFEIVLAAGEPQQVTENGERNPAGIKTVAVRTTEMKPKIAPILERQLEEQFEREVEELLKALQEWVDSGAHEESAWALYEDRFLENPPVSSSASGRDSLGSSNNSSVAMLDSTPADRHPASTIGRLLNRLRGLD